MSSDASGYRIMVRNEERSLIREIKKLYGERKSIIESIRDDVMNHECFFDDNLFARWYDVDGHKILGVLTNSRAIREYNGQSDIGTIGRQVLVFMCRASDISYVKENQVIRINGKNYYVTEARKIQDVYWRIELTVNE